MTRNMISWFLLKKNWDILFRIARQKNVRYRVVSHLEKVAHEIPALSLDKTKDRTNLVSWLNGKTGILSWKLDGLTVVVTYLDETHFLLMG